MIPLFKPHMPQCPDLQALFQSGKLSYGSHAKAFEARLCETLKTHNILGVSNFNAAVTAALLALGIGCGDEIIASPLSCLASTQPLLSTGASVVWGDVDPSMGTLCPDSVKARITNRTKLIVVNHFCGIIGDVDGVLKVSRLNNIPVAEDVLEGFGGRYHGKSVGSLCDLSWMSFGYIRLPQALDGAALWFSDGDLAQKARLICDLGIDRKHFRMPNGEINIFSDVDKYGIAASMSDVQGYIGNCSLNELDGLIKTQRDNARQWNELFVQNNGIAPITNSSADFCYWVYPTLTEKKEKMMECLKAQGFDASGVHISNHRYSVFGKQGEPPGAVAFESNFLALPCGWWVNCKKIKSCMEAEYA